MGPDASHPHRAPSRPAWRAAIALVALVALARLAYLAWACPYTLIEDEAHYWEWSRRLELSYYSKGPGVAWAIRAATEALGPAEWAVRLPAALAGALGALFAAGLARDALRDAPAAPLHAAAIYTCMPALWVLGLIITIDGPYLACWAGACWAAWRAMTRGSLGAWAALGLALALGFTFKYTVLLLAPGLAAAWWLARRDAARAGHPAPRTPRKGVLLAGTIAALGLAPVLAWNASHDWITVRHLLSHLGVAGGDTPPTPGRDWSPLWMPELLAIQVAMAGPAMFLAIYAAVASWRARAEQPQDWHAARFFICCALPVLVFYLLVSLMAEPEGNWPLAAWVTAAPLGALGVARGRREYRRRLASWRERGAPGIRPHVQRVMMWRWTVGVGVIVALGFARADWLARLPVVGSLIPQGRLMFADVRALDAARRMDALESETGLEPVLMAQHYGRTSQMAYYLPGRPTVYCAGAYMDGPKKQYDLWDETSLASETVRARLAGRPALLVGGRIEQWEPAFERVEEAGQLEGEHKAGRLVYLGYGYRGFPGTPADTGSRP